MGNGRRCPAAVLECAAECQQYHPTLCTGLIWARGAALSMHMNSRVTLHSGAWSGQYHWLVRSKKNFALSLDIHAKFGIKDSGTTSSSWQASSLPLARDRVGELTPDLYLKVKHAYTHNQISLSLKLNQNSPAGEFWFGNQGDLVVCSQCVACWLHGRKSAVFSY